MFCDLMMFYKFALYINDWLHQYFKAHLVPLPVDANKATRKNSTGSTISADSGDSKASPGSDKYNKSSMTEDMEEDKPNKSSGNGRNDSNHWSHPNPYITNYYCYDQRVYNIYKLQENKECNKSFGVWDAMKLLNWKYIFITLGLLIFITPVVCYLGADMLSWFIFQKVFGYLFSHHLVVKSDIPV